MSTVYDELAATLKVGQKGKSDQAHFIALIKKANDLPDKAWEGLSKKAQSWVNDAVEAYDNKENLPTPSGFDTDNGDEAEEEETPKVKKAKGEDKMAKHSKANGKGKPEKSAKGGKGKVAVKASGKKKGSGLVGKRARKFTDDQRITVLVNKNPKREGTVSYDRFELYEGGKKGMTVAAALKAGVTTGDLNWDVKHEFIEIK